MVKKKDLAKIKVLLAEAEKSSKESAMGYDEGFYNGLETAFAQVLEILEPMND